MDLGTKVTPMPESMRRTQRENVRIYSCSRKNQNENTNISAHGKSPVSNSATSNSELMHPAGSCCLQYTCWFGAWELLAMGKFKRVCNPQIENLGQIVSGHSHTHWDCNKADTNSANNGYDAHVGSSTSGSQVRYGVSTVRKLPATWTKQDQGQNSCKMNQAPY